MPVSETDEDIILSKFGRSFPSTKEMSRFARERLEMEGELDPTDADGALVRFLTREEELFRALEKIVVEARLEEGFSDVDAFVSFSLSVQNRRKSRMGYALEHHLAALLDIRNLRYSRQAVTGGGNKPDFLFPGIEEYRDGNYTGNLAMLAAKSSLKDRWRQILVEAEKIQNKHLCTLDQSISPHQVAEMGVQRAILVIPEQLRASYVPESRNRIMIVEEFIEFVKPFASCS